MTSDEIQTAGAKQNRKKWVKALCSGEFEQAQSVLRDDSGHYCCLGVACELHRREFGGEWVTGVYRGSCTRLPPSVQVWLGLASADGRFSSPEPAFHSSLIGLNDSGHSFKEIAEVIEEERKGFLA